MLGVSALPFSDISSTLPRVKIKTAYLEYGGKKYYPRDTIQVSYGDKVKYYVVLVSENGAISYYVAIVDELSGRVVAEEQGAFEGNTVVFSGEFEVTGDMNIKVKAGTSGTSITDWRGC
ncbi:MAG: hypothetical protein J7J61_00870 [Candidatus Hydrothermae bacterium]|nr:hypothetical protein [Candidatus Hydrothermae bacterium]